MGALQSEVSCTQIGLWPRAGGGERQHRYLEKACLQIDGVDSLCDKKKP